MNRRRWLAAVSAAGLAGCASLLGPRTFTLSEAELTQRLSERFPLDRRLMQMLDVRLSAPRVRLLPQSNRVGIDVDLSLAEPLSQRALPLALSLDSALRYDSVQAAITLADVRVQSLRMDGLPPSLASTLQRFGPPIAEQVIEGTVVHRFTSDQLQQARGQGLQPESINVTPRGVEITLLPMPR